MPTANEREPIGVQESIHKISTSIHDDPPSIIAPFEILLDEEINDDFIRDSIESIAQYYNFLIPGRCKYDISNGHTMILII